MVTWFERAWECDSTKIYFLFHFFYYLLKENITFLIRTLNGNHFYTFYTLTDRHVPYPSCNLEASSSKSLWLCCIFFFYVECLLIDSLASLFGSTSHLQNGLLRYLVLNIRRAASVGRVVLCHVSCLSCEYFLDGRLPLCFFLSFLRRSFWLWYGSTCYFCSRSL